ncbi:rhamnan synthesis F family protein [Neoroseomonas lacus]|nr:rhamnan synthesis F family protein [Neoroseomonas lacus]
MPTSSLFSTADRLPWAEPLPLADGSALPKRGLSPVVDRPDRRISPWLRARSFLRRPRFEGSVLRAGLAALREELAALRADLAEAVNDTPRLLAIHNGAPGLARAPSVAAFVHYAPVAAVSGMVLRRIEQLRANGFAVVFISSAPGVPPVALARLRALCALVVVRRNHGLDFGAWHDVAPLLRRTAPMMQELLLANDSVCGPFRDKAPILAAMRAAGHGLFGLTENLAPRPHLQSYFLLARGRPVVADLLRFLDGCTVTASKRRTIRNGEVRLSAWMRRRGHAVAAWCGYETIERAALQQDSARRRLRALYPFLFRDIPRDSPAEAAMMGWALHRRPVNATHAFWRELVEEMGFPYLKTDLLLRNSIIEDAAGWRRLLADRDEAMNVVISSHLATMSVARRRDPGA